MNSLEDHSGHEVRKQLICRMKNSGLDTIHVVVTREGGKHKVTFTGSPVQVTAAEKILADWI